MTRRSHNTQQGGTRRVPSGQRRLRFEPLEDRRLLAAITVNTVVDENDGTGVGGVSLREAIAAAMPSDTINFDPALTSGSPATILLAHGELLIDKSLTISGPGAALLTIDAQQKSRVFNIDNGSSGYQQEVTLRAITITGGHVTIAPPPFSPPNGGGGIRSVAALTLSDCVVTGNTVTGNEYGAGGGIFIPDTFGPTTITNCTISDNSASGDGGGLYVSSSTPATVDDCIISDNVSGANGGGVRGYATITNSTISGNSAVNGGGAHGPGAVWIRDSAITANAASADGGGTWGFLIDGCSVSNNTAGGNGGGVSHALSGNQVAVSNSTISSNTAAGNGGGISVAVSVDRCTISSNIAGGNGGGTHNSSTITNSTIIDNTAANGGGAADGQTITNSTLARNTAGNGGGVYEGDEVGLAIRHSTITDNGATGSGGGIYSANSGVSVISHAILAGNSAPASPDLHFSTAVPSLVYSLIGDNSGTTLTPAPVGMPDANGNLIGTGAEPIDPLLGPLANNGGPTLTYALLIGSPAIDAGDPAARPGEGPLNNVVPFSDQRGEPFLRVRELPSGYPTAIDLGAYEVPGLVRGDYNGNGIADAADYVVWRKTDGQTGVPAFSGADGNGDHNIDNADYEVWRTSFGGTDLLPTRAIVGTLDDDAMMGTEFDDAIFGFAGNDVIQGGAGNDTLDGGVGPDTLVGGPGDNLMLGGPGTGADWLSGESGDDIMEGGLGSDRYFTPGPGGSVDFGHDQVTDSGGLGDRVVFSLFGDVGVEFFGLDLDANTKFDALQIKRNDNTVTIQNFFDNSVSELASLSNANKGTGFIEFIEFLGSPTITNINDHLKPRLQDGRTPGTGATASLNVASAATAGADFSPSTAPAAEPTPAAISSSPRAGRSARPNLAVRRSAPTPPHDDALLAWLAGRSGESSAKKADHAPAASNVPMDQPRALATSTIDAFFAEFNERRPATRPNTSAR